MLQAPELAGDAGDAIAALVARQRPNHALERPFYGDRAVYEREVARIFLADWLYVGHISEIPEPGDYLVFDVAGESVIVVRGDDGALRALVNVCRHRGSRVCSAARGHVRWFVCPYHGWTYGRDGRLQAARQMPRDFDKAAHGLVEVHAEVFHGLIFVSFAEEPAALGPVRAALDRHLAPFALERAKVADRRLYPIAANWKLALENYMECYHCGPAHPEFSQSHSIKHPPSRLRKLHASLSGRAEAAGVSCEIIDVASRRESGVAYYYDRYPLFDGYLTGSEDGRPLAPLLGDVKDYDGGASNLQVGALNHFLIYSDHAVVYRFTPRAVQETDCEIVWLVDGAAEAGRDYDRERLTWLWDVTTAEDKTIIERNQAGVNSRYYRPGPYAPMEDYVSRFIDWYLAAIV